MTCVEPKRIEWHGGWVQLKREIFPKAPYFYKGQSCIHSWSTANDGEVFCILCCSRTKIVGYGAYKSYHMPNYNTPLNLFEVSGGKITASASITSTSITNLDDQFETQFEIIGKVTGVKD